MDQETSSPEPTTSKPSGDKDARTIAMLCHLLGVFTSILVPLILWIVKKDDDSFIDDQGKEALNFQITLLGGYFAAGILSIVGIGLLLFPLLYLYNLIFGIIAALKANEGEKYRYPFAIRLIK